MNRREFIATGAAVGLALGVGGDWRPTVSAAGASSVLARARGPIFISREIPGLWSEEALTLEVRADASKAYLGRSSTSRDRQNLLVLSLDHSGQVVEGPDVFPDNAQPLPVGGRSTLSLLRVHPRGRKLYMSTRVDYPGLTSPPGPDPKVLSVLDLDAAGFPSGPTRSYDTGIPSGVLAGLAVHPTLDLLYLVGPGEPGVIVYRLDRSGEPQRIVAKIPVGHSGKMEVAVSVGGDHLYLGSYPNLLEVVSLDPSTGLPPVGSPPSVDSFDAGPPPGRGAPAYYQFLYTPQALYRRPPMVSGSEPDPNEAVAVWPLEPTTGKPSSSSRPTVASGLTGRALAVDGERRTLWLGADDTFKDLVTGEQRRDGTVVLQVPLDNRGLAAGAGTPAGRSYFTAPLALAVAANYGAPVVLTEQPNPALPERGDQVRGWHLRVTVAKARPGRMAPQPLWLAAGRPRESGHKVAIGGSAVFALDDDLTGKKGQIALRVGVGKYGADPTLQQLTLQFEVFDGSPDSGARRLATLTETVAGNTAVLLLPGYGFVEPGEREAQIELLSDHAKRYLEAATGVRIKPSERPQKFPVSCYVLDGYQGHSGQLATMAEAMALLGFNTVSAGKWNGLSPDKINKTLLRYGLKYRSMGVYGPMYQFRSRTTPNVIHRRPLDFFDFYLQRYADDLKAWAEEQPGEAQTNGAAKAQVVDFKLTDEPGWSYPDVINGTRVVDGEVDGIVHTPAYLEAFRSYLREQGLTPEFFEKPSWSDVMPTSGAVDAPLAARRCWYWTARFFAVSASRGHKLATDALERAFGHELSVDVNWNNGLSAWCLNESTGFQPGPGDPLAGRGSFDWFESGRLSAHNPWSEDWFTDSQAQQWSTKSDVLRSVSMLGTRSFGAYVVGNTLGDHLPGASYKLLSLVGHGAKTLDVYTFGPYFFTSNGWSERLEIYPTIADAIRLLGRAERLLYPGRPPRGAIAIHVPATSALYDEDYNDRKLYTYEITWLHYALVHSGYAVDYVDDDDLSADVLAARGYTTLYLTGPNLPRAAFTELRNWVGTGHVLAVTPGAAVADEYNTPAADLDDVLGLAPRSPVRDCRNRQAPGCLAEARHYVDEVTPRDRRFGTASVPIIEPAVPLATRDAAVTATFGNGAAAITTRAYGSGTALAYGFFPGFQYFSSPDNPPTSVSVPLDPNLLPGPWGGPQRQLAIGPALVGRTPKPVSLDHDAVEACRLDAPDGVAVVLLNWTGSPVERLTMRVANARPYPQASTARRVKVDARPAGNDLLVGMPLADVDVLMLER